jgi:hypothetical protein
MCVQTANKSWERPATAEDAKILETYFKGIDLTGFLKTMQQDGCMPLTTDLALIGAVLTMEKNKFGVSFIPFTALEASSKSCVKIPEMENIVEWMENTALGNHMWSFANKFAEENYGTKFTFSMDCGCAAAPAKAFQDGTVSAWNRHLNEYAKNLYGKTNIIYRDSIEGTNMVKSERDMWGIIRKALESLPVESVNYSFKIENNYAESILR